jgi:predicted acetyltransferase
MAADLILRDWLPRDEAQARQAHAELATEHFDFLLGSEGGSFADYLAEIERMREGRDLPPGIAPSTFLAAFVGDELVGRVSIRHVLTERLFRVGGHIGYAVRPRHRGHGYATEILRQTLHRAADLGIASALVTCDDTNLASIAVIERCGGILDQTDAAASPGKRRYWIDTGRPAHPTG